MDKKRIIKNVLFIIFVPTIIVGAYYGGKFIIKKINDKKAQKNSENGN